MVPTAYQPYYCEENIWHLCRDPRFAGRECQVLFISNLQQSVAIWSARLAPPDEPVIWDYHVVLLCREGDWQIWDLDTRLAQPCAADAFLRASFRACHPRLKPLFRLIEADRYQDQFSSDRSHMRLAGGGFRQPPPPWPPIFDGVQNRLEGFIDMSDTFHGPVFDMAGLVAFLDRGDGDQSERSSKKSSPV